MNNYNLQLGTMWNGWKTEYNIRKYKDLDKTVNYISGSSKDKVNDDFPIANLKKIRVKRIWKHQWL